MNKQQRRKCVAVAQDVVAHLNLLNVARGTYCEGNMPSPSNTDDFVTYDGNDQASLYIDGMSKNCRVCAVGACFLSYIRVYNKVPLNQFIGIYGTSIDSGESFSLEYTDMARILHDIFSSPQLQLIEAAFEQSAINDNCVANNENDYDTGDTFYYDHDEDTKVTLEEMNAAEKFGNKYDVADERLKAIMKNIVANDGEFIPCKKTKKLIEKKRHAGEQLRKIDEERQEFIELLESRV